MQIAVERAIETMWKRYEEPLSLDEIANTAILSKFYFSRVFRNLTGTSPGRFLSAVRLHQAKTMLLETDLSVTEISYRVGYNSLGTFTSRFTRSVSLSPARYRALARAGLPERGGRPGAGAAHSDGGRRTFAVNGSIRSPEAGQPVRIYIGAFREPIVQGRPVACEILDRPGPFTLRAPEGVWFIRAAVVPASDFPVPPWERRPLFVASGPELCVRHGQDNAPVKLAARQLTALDLPILLALPELDSPRRPADGTAPLRLPALSGV
ncbi:helix-turn-helix transcriptional regulator [Kitasatospora sp. NPDC056783]|uniref:helix-turn-helix transcriptional regulator n=1 Tax=Kitasatospora sp. NPDC056783 TaxID=3345943 RepID=UPI00368E72AD